MIPVAENSQVLELNAATCIAKTRDDWDAYERSWDFQALPILARIL